MSNTFASRVNFIEFNFSVSAKERLPSDSPAIADKSDLVDSQSNKYLSVSKNHCPSYS